jgi:hypothetical protein
VADPAQLPGKKVWTYGHGRHRPWANATTEGNLAYLEIESGPLLDQSEKPLFRNGDEQHYEEYWIPVHSRAACDDIAMPKLKLPPMTDPWLGWQHSGWQTEWENFRAGAGPLPKSCVPTGLDLEAALRHTANAAEPLALWLAFRGRNDEALALVKKRPSPTAQRLTGLILWKTKNNSAAALPHLEAGPLHDPIAVIELDELYAQLKLTAKRTPLLANAPAHRLVIERRADLALALGNPAECLRLLSETAWPREHQRYVRTELWKAANVALGQPNAPVPDSLNEDILARFGAYWS